MLHRFLLSKSVARESFSVQDECDLQVHTVHHDLAILNHHLLFLDPGAFDVVNGLGSPGDATLNGILKTFGRLATDLDNLRDGHKTPSLLCAWALFNRVLSKREASKVLSPICGNPQEMIDIAREKPSRRRRVTGICCRISPRCLRRGGANSH
jgi:hypothetical protein